MQRYLWEKMFNDAECYQKIKKILHWNRCLISLHKRSTMMNQFIVWTKNRVSEEYLDTTVIDFVIITKVHVFSDSVLCFGKVLLQHPECNEAWKKKIEAVTTEKNFWDYDAINGESTEFEWNIFPGFTTFRLCGKANDLLSSLGQTPETVTGRILFMSMFNDISCDKKDNEREYENWTCIGNHDELSALQTRNRNSNKICESRRFSFLGQNFLWDNQKCERFSWRWHRKFCRSTRRGKCINKVKNKVESKSKTSTEGIHWNDNRPIKWKSMDWYWAIKARSRVVQSLEESHQSSSTNGGSKRTCQCCSDMLFKDILETILLNLHHWTTCWLDLECSLHIYHGETISIFIQVWEMDWNLEVIWAENNLCSSCLLIQEMKSQRPWIYWLLCTTSSKIHAQCMEEASRRSI